MEKVYVYIAGPYSQGDVIENVGWAIDMGELLMDHGLIPFVPHLMHFWEFRYPHELDYWYAYDLAWLARCDCLLRLPGESEGADKEVEFAKAHGIPVFNHIDDCLKWTRDHPKEKENCEWKYDANIDAWDSDCGECFCFMEGTPAENNMRFCHGCGHPVVVVAVDTPAAEDEDDE